MTRAFCFYLVFLAPLVGPLVMVPLKKFSREMRHPRQEHN